MGIPTQNWCDGGLRSPSLFFILISVKGSSRTHPEDLSHILLKPLRPFPYISSCLLLLQSHCCIIYLMLPKGLHYSVPPFYPVTLLFCPSPRKGHSFLLQLLFFFLAVFLISQPISACPRASNTCCGVPTSTCPKARHMYSFLGHLLKLF